MNETRTERVIRKGEDEYEVITIDDTVDGTETVPGPGMFLTIERHTVVEKIVVYKNGEQVETRIRKYSYDRVIPDIKDTVKLYSAIAVLLGLVSVSPLVRDLSRRDIESLATMYLPNEYGEGIPVFKAVSPDEKKELKGLDILKAPEDYVITVNDDAKPLIEKLKNSNVLENEY